MSRRIDRARKGLALMLTALTLVLLAATIWLRVTVCGQVIADFELFNAIESSMLFAAIGLLIVLYQPVNRIGWLFLLSGAGLIGVGFAGLYVPCAQEGKATLPGAAYIAWLIYASAPFLLVVLPLGLLPLWFPNGQFLSPRWRRVALALFVLLLSLVLLVGLLPGPLQGNGLDMSFPMDNPFGYSALPAGLSDVIPQAILVTASSTVFLGIASLIVRWRRSRGDTRQQLKWLVSYLVMFVTFEIVIGLVGEFVYPDINDTLFYWQVSWIVNLGLPIVMGLAIFKYRLYDIDIIIRRTLVYGGLTATLAVLYFGGVVVLQRLLPAESPLAIVISTLAIAVLFSPLRWRIQNDIDRLFYRRKYDAQKTLAAFAATARDETDVDALMGELVRVVEETMQPAHVSLWLRPAHNRPPDSSEKRRANV